MRLTLKLVFMLGLLTGACAVGAVPRQAGAGWCTEAQGPGSDDWTPLSGARIAIVRESERPTALLRLTERSVIALSRPEVVRFAPAGADLSGRRVYLVRGGMLLSTEHSDRDLRDWEGAPMFEIFWSRRHRATAVLTMRSTRDRVVPYDLPVLLETSVRPRQSYVTCVSAD